MRTRIAWLLAALVSAGPGSAAAEESVKQKVKAASHEFHKKARAARREAGKEARKLRGEGRKARLELKRRIKGENQN